MYFVIALPECAKPKPTSKSSLNPSVEIIGIIVPEMKKIILPV
jgi:hypothetical protein